MAAHDLNSARVFPVSRSALFAAFADPTRLARWWGPAGVINMFETFEFRTGGRWTFVMRMPDGTEYPMQHRFVEVAPPERIVVAHEQAGHNFTLTAQLEAVDAAHTRLLWRMRFDSAAEAARVRGIVLAANEENFDRLAAELEATRRPEHSSGTRPLRYSINVTLDGCCDHRVMIADEDLHSHAVENLERADALLFGRVTYEMMEAGWRGAPAPGARPEWMERFAHTIDAAKKYVVSSTLKQVDWNAELIRGDLATAVRELKRVPGKGLLVGGVTLPKALAELGLIDEYEFVVHPRVVGHGPTLFAGLSKLVDLKLVSQVQFGSGAVAMRYEPRG